MYYKVTNKECDVYKKLHEMRSYEIEANKRNLERIKEEVKVPFETFLGNKSQQNFTRTITYRGFLFLDESLVDTKIWRKKDNKKGLYVPNRRTRLGRKMDDFLLRELETSWFDKPHEILLEDKSGNYMFETLCFPYVEIMRDGTILVYLDDLISPIDTINVIEITKREFESYFEENLQES